MGGLHPLPPPSAATLCRHPLPPRPRRVRRPPPAARRHARPPLAPSALLRTRAATIPRELAVVELDPLNPPTERRRRGHALAELHVPAASQGGRGQGGEGGGHGRASPWHGCPGLVPQRAGLPQPARRLPRSFGGGPHSITARAHRILVTPSRLSASLTWLGETCAAVAHIPTRRLRRASRRATSRGARRAPQRPRRATLSTGGRRLDHLVDQVEPLGGLADLSRGRGGPAEAAAKEGRPGWGRRAGGWWGEGSEG